MAENTRIYRRTKKKKDEIWNFRSNSMAIRSAYFSAQIRINYGQSIEVNMSGLPHLKNSESEHSKQTIF